MSNKHSQTYTSFSGADMVMYRNGVVFGNLLGITWSIFRESAPIYIMADPDKPFKRGVRKATGSLIMNGDQDVTEPFDICITFENDEGNQTITWLREVEVYKTNKIAPENKIAQIKHNATYTFMAEGIGPHYSTIGENK